MNINSSLTTNNGGVSLIIPKGLDRSLVEEYQQQLFETRSTTCPIEYGSFIVEECMIFNWTCVCYPIVHTDGKWVKIVLLDDD